MVKSLESPDQIGVTLGGVKVEARREGSRLGTRSETRARRGGGWFPKPGWPVGRGLVNLREEKVEAERFNQGLVSQAFAGPRAGDW